MPPNFELHLEERGPDRVFVSVLLGPGPEGPAEVDGVAITLVGPTGEPLSHRLLLPIAGQLTQAFASTAELRAHGPLPQGARVVGTVWRGAEQWEASCPADPGTQLEAHTRGLVRVQPQSDEVFEPLSPAERGALAAAFPWTAPAAPPPLRVMECEPADAGGPEDPDSLRAYCRDLGLGDEDADWLESLLDEDG